MELPKNVCPKCGARLRLHYQRLLDGSVELQASPCEFCNPPVCRICGGAQLIRADFQRGRGFILYCPPDTHHRHVESRLMPVNGREAF